MIEEYGEIPDDETIAAAQSVSQPDDIVSTCKQIPLIIQFKIIYGM